MLQASESRPGDSDCAQQLCEAAADCSPSEPVSNLQAARDQATNDPRSPAGQGGRPAKTPPARIPKRPAHRPGYVTELVLEKGQWCWRRRLEDAAEQAYAAHTKATMQ